MLTELQDTPVKGMREEDAAWIEAARGNGYPDVESLWRRAGVPPRALERLAEGMPSRRSASTAAPPFGPHGH